jgi:hypothetical protein
LYAVGDAEGAAVVGDSVGSGVGEKVGVVGTAVGAGVVVLMAHANPRSAFNFPWPSPHALAETRS